MGPSPGSLFFSHCHRPRPPVSCYSTPHLLPSSPTLHFGPERQTLRASAYPPPSTPHRQPQKSKGHPRSCETGSATSPAPLPPPHQITSQLLTTPCSDSSSRPPPALLPLPGVPFLSGVPVKVLFKRTPLRSLRCPCAPAHPSSEL